MFIFSGHKRLSVFFCSFFLFFSIVHAEGYRITSVRYDIKGMTRKYALATAVPVDTARVFPDRPALEQYLADLLTRLKNQRVLEEAAISPFFGIENAEGVTPVDLLIATKDTWNIIALPYPKYDSNRGFVLIRI